MSCRLKMGYLISGPGVLQILQIIFGSVCVGISAHYFHYFTVNLPGQMFFFLMSVTMLILTTILLLSCVLSYGTSKYVPETIYEFIYNIFACLLYGASAAVIIDEIHERITSDEFYAAFMSVGVIGGVLCLVYAVSAVFSIRAYRSRNDVTPY